MLKKFFFSYFKLTQDIFRFSRAKYIITTSGLSISMLCES